jgi:hypothetical protein
VAQAADDFGPVTSEAAVEEPMPQATAETFVAPEVDATAGAPDAAATKTIRELRATCAPHTQPPASPADPSHVPANGTRSAALRRHSSPQQRLRANAH